MEAIGFKQVGANMQRMNIRGSTLGFFKDVSDLEEIGVVRGVGKDGGGAGLLLKAQARELLSLIAQMATDGISEDIHNRMVLARAAAAEREAAVKNEEVAAAERKAKEEAAKGKWDVDSMSL